MSDRELCEAFGTTLEDVEAGVSKVEAGDFSDFDLSRVIVGRPMVKEPMRMVSAPVPVSSIEAMNRVADEQGISRSEFVRRAIDHELLAMA